jgi:hypothetical protein
VRSWAEPSWRLHTTASGYGYGYDAPNYDYYTPSYAGYYYPSYYGRYGYSHKLSDGGYAWRFLRQLLSTCHLPLSDWTNP